MSVVISVISKVIRPVVGNVTDDKGDHDYSVSNLELESGDDLLKEDGFLILLEQ